MVARKTGGRFIVEATTVHDTCYSCDLVNYKSIHVKIGINGKFRDYLHIKKEFVDIVARMK